MDVFNGKKASIKIAVMNNENYARLADTDEIMYSLYDLNGEIVEGIDDYTIDPTDLDSRSFIEITIPGEANILDENKEFDNRVLTVNYTLNGADRFEKKSYRIIPFVPYTCSADDVRTMLGVGNSVIEDDMVDIYAAYLKCKSLMSDPDELLVCLISGDHKTTLANRAITLCSALTFRSSLPLLTPKIESDSVVSQTRFTTTVDDFNKLFDALQEELEDILADLEDVSMDDRFSPDLFVIGNLTDTFTGS